MTGVWSLGGWRRFLSRPRAVAGQGCRVLEVPLCLENAMFLSLCYNMFACLPHGSIVAPIGRWQPVKLSNSLRSIEPFRVPTDSSGCNRARYFLFFALLMMTSRLDNTLLCKLRASSKWLCSNACQMYFSVRGCLPTWSKSDAVALPSHMCVFVATTSPGHTWSLKREQTLATSIILFREPC